MYASHLADVLFVVQAVDNRAGAKKQHGLEKGVGADVKEC